MDTEEEFDWHKPFSRTSHALSHLTRLHRFQEFCEGAGVVPVYLIDYPVARSELAIAILGDAAARGAAEIGIQLHPWVNPPHEEQVTDWTSFPGNLPEDLERRKFTLLKRTIEDNFGIAPAIYRAGRYGLGPHTARILQAHGIAVDSSVRAGFDYRAAGGANYRTHPLHPYWVDDARALMELPLTTVFNGPLRRGGAQLYARLWRVPRLRGALAHLRLLERIPLTPEGITPAEALRGIDRAVAQGLPVLVFSFHSPSLQPGHTPYVRDEDDVDRLYHWWREAFARCARHGVKPTTIAEITRAVEL